MDTKEYRDIILLKALLNALDKLKGLNKIKMPLYSGVKCDSQKVKDLVKNHGVFKLFCG
jgi:hypothetical protein